MKLFNGAQLFNYRAAAWAAATGPTCKPTMEPEARRSPHLLEAPLRAPTPLKTQLFRLCSPRDAEGPPETPTAFLLAWTSVEGRACSSNQNHSAGDQHPPRAPSSGLGVPSSRRTRSHWPCRAREALPETDPPRCLKGVSAREVPPPPSPPHRRFSVRGRGRAAAAACPARR